MAFWEHVNWVKVHSDFAKDASPTIEALHGRVSQAYAQSQQPYRSVPTFPCASQQAGEQLRVRGGGGPAGRGGVEAREA